MDLARGRRDLAAAFRLCHRFGWSGSVGNHFSVAVSGDGRRFLMNPRWRHFGAMRAPAGLDIDQQLAPALGALAHADLGADELLLPLRRGPRE